MRIKTSELQGAALDWAVAICQGLDIEFEDPKDPWLTLDGIAHQPLHSYTPSTEWSQGGPIIERYCINLFRLDPKTEEDNRFWIAHIDGIYCRYGVSALIAAMRCYVASQLGDDVEIPEGLL